MLASGPRRRDPKISSPLLPRRTTPPFSPSHCHSALSLRTTSSVIGISHHRRLLQAIAVHINLSATVPVMGQRIRDGSEPFSQIVASKTIQNSATWATAIVQGYHRLVPT
jgi:hypothetical protein